MPTISIITAIHNGLAFNKLYYFYLQKYTVNPFELIIIDNASTDGSREFFEEKGARVIKNKVNYSYPYCQNQGIAAATGDYLFFLNNDLIVSPKWDELLIETSKRHNADVLSASGIENMGNRKDTKRLDHKWKRTKNLLMVFGFGEKNLAFMHKVMYGNWEKFCAKLFAKNGWNIAEGIVGNNVMMTRRGINILGLWDERIQSADFDLFMRSKKRALTDGDIKPCQIALGAFIHHYGKMTVKYAVKPKPFADQVNLIGLHDKWSRQEIDEMHPDNSTIRKR